MRPILFLYENGYLLTITAHERMILRDVLRSYAHHIKRSYERLAYFVSGIRLRPSWMKKQLGEFHIFADRARNNIHPVISVFDFNPEDQRDPRHHIRCMSSNDKDLFVMGTFDTPTPIQ
jgi:hypothetical protein